jgi:hypothetical protein
MNDLLKFYCDFGGGIAVAVTFDKTAYRRSQGKDLAQKFEWSGNPTEEIFPRYLEWMHSVNTEIAKAINRDYMYIFNPRCIDQEIWRYYPDGYRERVEPSLE